MEIPNLWILKWQIEFKISSRYNFKIVINKAIINIATIINGIAIIKIVETATRIAHPTICNSKDMGICSNNLEEVTIKGTIRVESDSQIIWLISHKITCIEEIIAIDNPI